MSGGIRQDVSRDTDDGLANSRSQDPIQLPFVESVQGSSLREHERDDAIQDAT